MNLAEFHIAPSRAQRDAVAALAERSYRMAGDFENWSAEYYRLIEAAYFEIGRDPALMVPWKGMILGIERDGYTHS